MGPSPCGARGCKHLTRDGLGAKVCCIGSACHVAWRSYVEPDNHRLDHRSICQR
jgi:hypothetical protein